MYDFKNKVINGLLLAAGVFVGFVIAAFMLGTIEFIILLSFVWAVCGLAGWGIGRMSGKIEDEVGVPFYKEAKFYEYIARGPISFMK